MSDKQDSPREAPESVALLAPDTEKLHQAQQFLNPFSSVILSSVKENATAHASYAPFIVNNDCFYVYVSGLAEHSRTLKNGSACLFFIEEEKQAKNIFARTRISIDCQVLPIDPEQSHYQSLLDKFEQRHGTTVKLLRALPDFILFELRPLSASFVTGFGATYDISHPLPAIMRSESAPPVPGF